MRIILPHLPHNFEQHLYSCFRDFLSLLPLKKNILHCDLIRISNVTMDKMHNNRRRNSHRHAKIDLKTIFGVVRSNNLSLVETFLQENGIDCINQFDSEGYTPVHWAIFDGNEETVKFLLDNNAIYESNSNKFGQAPIHWACTRGRIEMVNMLIEKGVNINTPDKKGYTPLITASQYGHVALVAYLVSRGANLETEDLNGDNSLHWAVYKGHPDLTRLLIIYGLNPKKIDNYGQTLLHLASLSGNLNIIQHLIEEDAIDTEIVDQNGKKAIDLARTRGHKDIVNFIERNRKNKKNKYFNLKSLFFGPVGNSKLVFYFIHFLYIFYEYPAYFYRVVPQTWPENKLINVLFIINTIIMWYSFYTVHLTDPGYLKQNTYEYQSFLRKLTFRFETFNAQDWTKNLSRLCHTCKAIKPYRASHCRACNRCVLAYDHHCPYVQNCIGFKNRPWFFLFVLSTTTLQLITGILAYLCFSRYGYDQYLLYPGVFIITLFGSMTAILTFGSITSACTNLTGNELAKRKKYDYLKGYTAKGSRQRSVFDKGVLYNIKYYFHLVEPSQLETSSYEIYPNYMV